MRNALLLLVLAVSLAACASKKKSPAAPMNMDTAPKAEQSEREEQDMSRPTDSDDAATSSDPCEGGE